MGVCKDHVVIPVALEHMQEMRNRKMLITPCEKNGLMKKKNRITNTWVRELAAVHSCQ